MSLIRDEDDFIMATGGEHDVCQGCRHLLMHCTCGPEYQFERHGSMWLCIPRSENAAEWLFLHAPGDPEQLHWFHGSLVVEPAHVIQLAEQLETEGFTTEL